MLRTIFTAGFLFALWFLLSGIEKPITLFLGVVSSITAALVVRRMERLSPSGQLKIAVKPLRLVRYSVWLLGEIAKANWAVTKTIMAPKLRLRQHLFTIPKTQKTDLGEAAFANSITLTPGTISVDVEKDQIVVHALNYTADDRKELAKMDAWVSSTEAEL